MSNPSFRAALSVILRARLSVILRRSRRINISLCHSECLARRIQSLFLSLILILSVMGCQKTSINPPLRVFPDMDDQKIVKPQSEFSFFEGGQSLQYPIEGTVARNSSPQNKNESAEYAKFLYSSYCLPCHGATGEGYGPVSKRETAALLRPPSLKDGITRAWSDEQIHQLITQGRGRMGSYAHLISFEDRSAVVRYIRQLQKNNGAE